MEERLNVLIAACNNAEKGKNTSSEKFDAIWDIDDVLRNTPKATIEKLSPEFIKFLLTSIQQGTGGLALRRAVASAMNSLFDYDAQMKGPLNLVKLLHTYIAGTGGSSAKAANQLQAKVATLYLLGYVGLKRPIQVARVLVETVGLLSKQFKASEVQLRRAALTALHDTLEGAAYNGSFIHADVLKGIKPAFQDKSNEVRVGACECLCAIAKYAGNNVSYMEGSTGGLATCVKLLEDNVAEVRSAACVAIATQLSQAILNKLQSSGQNTAQAAAAKKSKEKLTVWNLDTSLAYLGGLFTKNNKREVRAGFAHTVSLLLKQLPKRTIEKNIDRILQFAFGLLSSSISAKTPVDESLQARVCVTYILRYGLSDHLGEGGQETVAKSLARSLQKLLSSQSASAAPAAAGGASGAAEISVTIPFTLEVLLRELSYLVLLLGESALVVRESLCNDTLPVLLTYPDSSCVRLLAAVCYRALGTALPNSISHILSDLIAKATLDHGALSGSKPAKLKQTLLSLQGTCHGIASLLSSIEGAPLGVPKSVASFAFQTATAVLRTTSNNVAIAVITAECGWSIMGALMKMGPEFLTSDAGVGSGGLGSGPVSATRLAVLFQLWNSQLATEAPPKQERDLAIFAQIKSQALVALASFITHCPSLLSTKVLNQIVLLLNNVLGVMSSISGDNKLAIQASSTHDVLKLLKLHLTQAFNALPLASFTSAFVPLLKFLASEIIEGVGSSSLVSLLHQDDEILSTSDQHLSPSDQQRMLLDFGVEFGQDSSAVWSANIQSALVPSVDVAVSLVNGCVELFGKIFVTQAEKNRIQLLEHFVAVIKAAPPARKQAIQINVMCAVLSLLKELVKKRATLGQGKSLTTILDFIKGFIGDPVSELRRATSESLGMLCKIEGDKFANEMVKSITTSLSKAKDPVTRSGCIFSLGCVKRYLGGMRSSAHLVPILGVVRDVLIDVTTAPLLHIWTLHTLCLTIEAAGPSFAPSVGPTLSMIYSLLLTEEYSSTLHYECIGTIVHAVVHSLGPELSAQPAVIKQCNAIAAQLRHNYNDHHQYYSHALVQLEATHFEQSLIMFAPQNVNVHSVVPFLRNKLQSPVEQLRTAAVICLRQLIQCVDQEKVIASLQTVPTTHSFVPQQQQNTTEQGISIFIEELFVMLDNETESKARNEVSLLVNTLLDLLAADAPTQWITVMKKIVVTSKRTNIGGGAAPAPGDKDKQDEPESDAGVSSPDGDDDDDDMGDDEHKPDEVDDSGLVGSSNSNETEDHFVPRWRTKVFAMECVRRVIAVVAATNKAAHFDLLLARSTSGPFLVTAVPDLVTLAFMAGSSDIQPMRPFGLSILQDVVQHFGHSMDPDFEGHSLLEQYQAQILSSLRPAFEFSEASPYVTVAACKLLVTYVMSALTDPKLVGRMLPLLIAPVHRLTDMSYTAYSDKATNMVQLAIMTALAQLYLLANTTDKEKLSQVITEALSPQLHVLANLWVLLLRDYAVLTTQSRVTQKSYTANFFAFSSIQPTNTTADASGTAGERNVAEQSEIEQAFHNAFQPVLLATTALVGTPYWLKRIEIVSEDSVSGGSNQRNGSIDAAELYSDDFFLLLGLSINALSGHYDTNKALLTLKCCKQLLVPPYLNPKYLPYDTFKEVITIIVAITDAGNLTVQLEVAKFLLNIAAHTNEYANSPHGEAIMDSLLEMSVLALHRNIPTLFNTTSTDPIDIGPESLAVVETQLNALGTFATQWPTPLRFRYGPSIFFVLIRLIQLASSLASVKDSTLIINTASQTIKSLAKSPQDITAQQQQEWQQILHAVVGFILSLLNNTPESAPNYTTNVTALLSALFAVLMECQSPEAVAALHQPIVSWFKKAVNSSNTKIQSTVLSGLRVLLQAANIDGTSSTPTSLSHLQLLGLQYFQALGGDLVVLLFHASKAGSTAVNPEYLAVIAEVIRLLIFTHSLLDDAHQPALLAVIVPSLVGLLNTNAAANTLGKSLHDVSLQVLLKLASTSTHFKSQVALLSDGERQLLEQSIRQSVAAQQQQQAQTVQQTTVATAKPLKLDFTKWNK